MKVWYYSLLLFVTTLMGCFLLNDAQIDPTFGFVEVMLNETSFEYHKPYDTPLEQRYSYANRTHRFWVYADDTPHHLGSNTQPRTEIRIHPDYTSGIWQFEGMAFVPNGTSGATIVQIHGAAHGNTTILLRIYDGDMRYYSTPVIYTGLYDKWFKVNLIHDVDGGKVTVFIDNQERLNMHDQGPGLLHFKFGVYGAPRNISYYMESRWKAVKIYKKC
ncbi:putative concanavalin A-like lectin/glucanase domain superfamily, alginate lyase 2 [Helianthus annuus]|nr:putative concanavalin A-like lectin/glucanase domain superfamily, alginate lyase 2 [Helianthus annuus]